MAFEASLATFGKPTLLAPASGGRCLAEFPGTSNATANVTGRTFGFSTGLASPVGAASPTGVALTFLSSEVAGPKSLRWDLLDVTLEGAASPVPPATPTFKEVAFDIVRTLLGNAFPTPVAEIFAPGRQAGPVSASGCTDCAGSVAQLAAGTYSMCALRGDATVACWGSGYNGTLGQGNTASSRRALAVPGLSDVVQISGQFSTLCALSGPTSLRSVHCWGRANGGGGGDVLVPSVIHSAPGLRSIAVVSDGAVLVVEDNGRLLCKKTDNPVRCDNMAGTDLPGGIMRRLDAPTDVLGAVGAGETICALTKNGSAPSSLQCWGQGYQGEHGDGGFRGDVSVPRTVGFPTALLGVQALGVAASDFNTATFCATVANTGQNEVRCWGNNFHGSLGVPHSSLHRTGTPRLVGGEAHDLVTYSSAGLYSICGVRTDGKVVCWGNNAAGLFGFPTSETATPVVLA